MKRRSGIAFSPLMLPYAALAIVLDQGRVVAGMLCAVIFHEAAHALAARLLSLEVASLRITPFGGIAEIEDLTGAARAEALVALAGPAASLALAMTLVFVHRYLPFSEAALRDMVQWNLLMCAFNLLPGLPLDGGRVLRALLTRRMGLRRATLLAAGMGAGIGIALMALAVAGAMYGVVNATLMAAALIMLFSGIGEMRGAAGGRRHGAQACGGRARARADGAALRGAWQRAGFSDIAAHDGAGVRPGDRARRCPDAHRPPQRGRFGTRRGVDAGTAGGRDAQIHIKKRQLYRMPLS